MESSRESKCQIESRSNQAENHVIVDESTQAHEWNFMPICGIPLIMHSEHGNNLTAQTSVHTCKRLDKTSFRTESGREAEGPATVREGN